MESDADPLVAYEEMGRSSNKNHGQFGRPMFVSTNVGTHLVIITDPSDTVADLRGKVRNGHLFCFPHFGEIDIDSLMVKHESLFYHLPDSIFVEAIFHGLNGTRYISVEISGSDLCNEKAGPRPNIGSGSLLKRCCSSQLQLNEKALSNRRCTNLDAVTEKKETINVEFAKDLKTLESGDKSLDLRENKRSEENRKELHDHNEDLSVHVLLENNNERRKQITKEVDNIVECSTGQVLEKIERDKNFQGCRNRQEKVSILNSTKDNSFKDVTVKSNNSHAEENPLRNIQDIGTVADGENEKGRKGITGTNHIMNSKDFCEEDSLHGARNKSGGVQGKAADARGCDIESKLKRKRKQSSQNVDDNENISTKDVNGVPQIPENDNLQGIEYLRTEQTPLRGTEKRPNRKRKRLSKKVLDGDQEGFAEDANGKPETTKHKNCLEYECKKREDICGASVVPGKKAQTKDANGAPVKYLDVVSHMEFDQQRNISGMKKSKRSRNDSSCVDDQEKIATKQEQNNDTLVNSMKGDGHERITDSGNKKRRDISNESGVKNLNIQHSGKDVAKLIEELGMVGSTPKTNNAYHNDAKAKFTMNSSLKDNQNRTINIEKRRKDEKLEGQDEKLEGQGASIVCDENAQTESYQHCDITPKRKMNHSSTGLSRNCGQERFITEKVLENDIKVNCVKGEGVESTPADGNGKKRDIPIENGRVTNPNVQHSPVSAARVLECSVEKIGTTYMMNNENCIDKKVKSSKRPSKTSQERTIDENCIDKKVKSSMRPSKTSQERTTDENCIDKNFKSAKRPSKTSQERTTDENCIDKKVQSSKRPSKTSQERTKDENCIDKKVQSSKSPSKTSQERSTDENCIDKKVQSSERPSKTSQERTTDENCIDKKVQSSKSPSKTRQEITTDENCIDKNVQSSKRPSKTSQERTIDENCIDKKVKSSKRPSKTSQERTTDVEQIGVDECVAKAVTSVQNVRYDKKKLTESLTLKIVTAPDGSMVIPPLNVPQGNNVVVEKHQTTENVFAKSTKASADVGCKSKQTRTAVTSCGFGTINTSNSSGEKKNTSTGAHKFQFSAENGAETLKQIGKFDTSDFSYSRKSLEELQDNADCSGKVQLENKKLDDDAQLKEQKQDADTQGKITIVGANDVCGDGKTAIEQHRIDGISKKLQLVGKTNDGLINRGKSKKAISHQKEKKSNKPTCYKHSKKDRFSLFKNDGDESTDGENPNYSYTMSSSSKRTTSDSSDSYASDAGDTEKISKSLSIRTKGDWEPSRSGALLSTAVGKAEDNGGNGSIHSRFVSLLSKKTSLGELFKIASSRRKSDQFGGRFGIDDSPSVDMVLETQDSQIDPILDSHNNTVLSNQTYKDGKFSIEASKTILASKSHPNDTQKALQKFDFSSSLEKPNMNTVQLKHTLEKHIIDESGQMETLD